MTALAWKRIVAAALLAATLAEPGFAPRWLDRAAAADIGDPAPEFTGIEKWLNSEPLTIADLKGKVVLIDFWTYSYINCLRTLPYLAKWYDTYRDKGFVVVGVHTPEFAFERVTRNVQAAIQRHGIRYPVAQDNRYATWQAYRNESWPSLYLVDRNGVIVRQHAGEGQYDQMENAIRNLVAAPAPAAGRVDPDLRQIRSPEMYFGSLRLQYLASPQPASSAVQVYAAPAQLDLNRFALVGSWVIDDDNATLAEDQGEIVLRFRSGKVHMVASSQSPVTVSVVVDDKPQTPLTIQASRLYTLFDGDDYGTHLLRIQIPKAGLKAFTFSFG